MHPVTAGSGFVTALNLPSLSQLLVHPVPKSLMAHLAGTLDPASLLLHRHRHLPIVHIQSQLQDPIAMLPHTCSVATTARYCLVRFIHRADSLAAGAVSCRLMSSKIVRSALIGFSAVCAIAKIEKLVIMPSMHSPDSTGTREPREIKQIATLCSGEIVALCNDDSVWIYAGSSWQKLPDIPKEDDR